MPTVNVLLVHHWHCIAVDPTAVVTAVGTVIIPAAVHLNLVVHQFDVAEVHRATLTVVV